MARPSKPAQVLTIEKKSHRTKKELAVRQSGETDLLTNRAMEPSCEVRCNKDALKEFNRVSELLGAIGKNDALYEATINRYCMLKAEESELMRRLKDTTDNLDYVSQNREQINPDEYMKLYTSLTSNMVAVDKQLQQKRKMLFDIEKENVMTIAAALRSIPKKPEAKKSALLEALSG